MYKDWKIGLAAGLTVVLFAVVRLALDPRLGIRARFQNNAAIEQPVMAADEPNLQKTVVVLPREASTNKEELRQEITLPTPQEQLSPLMPVSAPEQAPVIQPQQNRTEINLDKKEQARPERIHIVQPNQTLWSIAGQYYGKAESWKKIFDANRKVIKDPNKLSVGTKLLIPD
jgi:nucleoid-associated protein YgaU